MDTEISKRLQEQTRDLLSSIIYHQQLNMDLLIEDAVWFVDSSQVQLGKWEIVDYLEQSAIDAPGDIPTLKYTRVDEMGVGCRSLVGTMEYHSIQDREKLIKVIFHSNWVEENGQWLLKQLITSSQFLYGRQKDKYGEMRLDYKTLIRHLPFALICCTLESNLPVQRISEKALALLGYDSIQDYRHNVGGTIMSAVHPEDMQAFREYQQRLRDGAEDDQITLRLRKRDFSFVQVQLFGTFVKEGWMVFACLDNTENEIQEKILMREHKQLKEEHESGRSLIEYMPSGFHRCALFDPVHVDYVSDSLCEMTGYTREDIFVKMKSIYTEMIIPEDREPVEKAVMSLMQYPHTEQVIYRFKRKDGGITRVLDKTRSVRHPDGKIWGYSIVIALDDMLPAHPELSEKLSEEDEQDQVTDHRHHVEIHTFGYFEVWVDGSPIAFRSAKARELLALLVDRRGNFTSRESIIGNLWEDETVNPTTLSRCRKTYMNLAAELKNYDIDDILETENGMRRIIPEKVRCDLFDYYSGDPEAIHQFKGMYMNEYSWSEMTLAALINPKVRMIGS